MSVKTVTISYATLSEVIKTVEEIDTCTVELAYFCQYDTMDDYLEHQDLIAQSPSIDVEVVWQSDALKSELLP